MLKLCTIMSLTMSHASKVIFFRLLSVFYVKLPVFHMGWRTLGPTPTKTLPTKKTMMPISLLDVQSHRSENLVSKFVAHEPTSNSRFRKCILPDFHRSSVLFGVLVKPGMKRNEWDKWSRKVNVCHCDLRRYHLPFCLALHRL